MTTPGSPIGHIASAGFWTGEGPLLSGRPQTLTLVARTPVEAPHTPLRAVQALLACRPQDWQQIGRLALIQGQLATTIGADLMIANSRQRCAATLLRLVGCRFSDPQKSETPTIAVAQEELAAMANLTRHTAGPILHSLAKDGTISLAYRMITIVKAAELRAFADGD